MAVVNETQRYFDVRRSIENRMGATVDVVSYEGSLVLLFKADQLITLPFII